MDLFTLPLVQQKQLIRSDSRCDKIRQVTFVYAVGSVGTYLLFVLLTFTLWMFLAGLTSVYISGIILSTIANLMGTLV